MTTATLSSRIAREIRNALFVAAGVFSAGMGLKGFLLSSHFIDGGVTGISMLLTTTTGIPLAIWLPLVNAPFIALACRHLGAAFAVRSALAIAGLALVLATVKFPDVTPDLLLTAVFGGLFIGAGVGLAVRGGAVLDGTEVAALLLSKRSALFKVGDVILAFNVVLFVIAMGVLGVDAALYSILTYAAAARTLDFVLHGLEAYTALTIVSPESAEIRRRITEELGRGVTVYRGAGGVSDAPRDILSSVVTRLEVDRVMAIVKDVDPSAFVTSHVLLEVRGGVVRAAAAQH